MGLPALKLETTAPVPRPVQVLTFKARTPGFSIGRALPGAAGIHVSGNTTPA